jgi:hypothetical protein
MDDTPFDVVTDGAAQAGTDGDTYEFGTALENGTADLIEAGDFSRRIPVNMSDEEYDASLMAGYPEMAKNILTRVLAKEPKYILVAYVSPDDTLGIESSNMAPEILTILADEVQTISMANLIGMPVDVIRALKANARNRIGQGASSALDVDGASPVG